MKEFITAVKSFMIQFPGVNVIKHFLMRKLERLSLASLSSLY
jgi:hypothetical protein